MRPTLLSLTVGMLTPPLLVTVRVCANGSARWTHHTVRVYGLREVDDRVEQAPRAQHVVDGARGAILCMARVRNATCCRTADWYQVFDASRGAQRSPCMRIASTSRSCDHIHDHEGL